MASDFTVIPVACNRHALWRTPLYDGLFLTRNVSYLWQFPCNLNLSVTDTFLWGRVRSRFWITVLPLIFSVTACCANCPGDINQWSDESNHVNGRFVTEVTANDGVTVIRPWTLTNRLSNFKVFQSAGTNRLINCFCGQIRANIDLSLLKIALAALVQIFKLWSIFPRIYQKKQLISR